MNSTERVTNTILGKPVDRQPIYGWVSANLSDEITAEWGSVANFEGNNPLCLHDLASLPNKNTRGRKLCRLQV